MNYYPFSKEDIVHDERDNIIRKEETKNSSFLIEHCLTPFRDEKVLDIIKEFQDSKQTDAGSFSQKNLEIKARLSDLLCNFIMRFK